MPSRDAIFWGDAILCQRSLAPRGAAWVSGEAFADLNLQVSLGLSLLLLNTQSASRSDERLVFTAEA